MYEAACVFLCELSLAVLCNVPVRTPGQHVTDSCGQDGGRVWQSSPVDDKYLL